MVITRHRALFGKPGDLKEIVELPCKRKSKQIHTHEALQMTPVATICDIVSMLREMLSSHDLPKGMQQRLEKEVQGLNKSALKELRLIVTEFDTMVSDQRTKIALDLLMNAAN